MIKRVLGTCLVAAALTITGKMISDYAETCQSSLSLSDLPVISRNTSFSVGSSV